MRKIYLYPLTIKWKRCVIFKCYSLFAPAWSVPFVVPLFFFFPLFSQSVSLLNFLLATHHSFSFFLKYSKTFYILLFYYFLLLMVYPLYSSAYFFFSTFFSFLYFHTFYFFFFWGTYFCTCALISSMPLAYLFFYFFYFFYTSSWTHFGMSMKSLFQMIN